MNAVEPGVCFQRPSEEVRCIFELARLVAGFSHEKVRLRGTYRLHHLCDRLVRLIGPLHPDHGDTHHVQDAGIIWVCGTATEALEKRERALEQFPASEDCGRLD